MVKKKQVYLDYAATTPVEPEAAESMEPYLTEKFANTASIHSMGAQARQALERARKKLSREINAQPEEVIFTSSATESNNLALKGLAWSQKDKKHLIISSLEHDCVLHAAQWLNQRGFDLTLVDVDENGRVDPEDVNQAIRDDTFLVSIMHANNEVGTFQPIKEIGRICHENDVLFHTDAAQTYGKYEIDVKDLHVDLLTASSHKLYGPKGVGLLYIRNGISIVPLLHGGGHEFGKRSSTVNVAGIVGFAKALEIAKQKKEQEKKEIKKLKEKLIDGILEKIDNVQLNGSRENSLYNIANFTFKFIEGESIVLMLDQAGIATSTGSACSSPTLEPSHVLIAMGLKPELAHGSVRFSLGRQNSEEDIDYVLEILPPIVEQLREVSPFK